MSKAGFKTRVRNRPQDLFENFESIYVQCSGMQQMIRSFFLLSTSWASLSTVAMSKDMIVFCHSGAFDWCLKKLIDLCICVHSIWY